MSQSKSTQGQEASCAPIYSVRQQSSPLKFVTNFSATV